MASHVDPGRLSETIGSIYDAAIAPEKLTLALQRTVELFDVESGGIRHYDVARRQGRMIATVGISNEGIEQYERDQHASNPLTPGYLMFRECEPVTHTMVMNDAEFVRTPFFRDWVEPQGWRWNLAVVLKRAVADFHSMTIMASARRGCFDEQDRELMGLLAPHFRKAITIAGILGSAQQKAESLAETLDLLSLAAVVVDGDMRIVHANAAAEAELKARAAIARIGERLHAVDAATDARLAADIVRCLDGGSARDLALPFPPATEDGLVAHVLPLNDGRRDYGLSHAGQAVVFFKSREATVEPPLRALSERYSLTGSELQVLLGLLDGSDPQAIAARLGVAVSTIRTHLHRLFQKTRTTTQSGLVRTVMALIPPIADVAR